MTREEFVGLKPGDYVGFKYVHESIFTHTEPSVVYELLYITGPRYGFLGYWFGPCQRSGCGLVCILIREHDVNAEIDPDDADLIESLYLIRKLM